MNIQFNTITDEAPLRCTYWDDDRLQLLPTAVSYVRSELWLARRYRLPRFQAGALELMRKRPDLGGAAVLLTLCLLIAAINKMTA